MDEITQILIETLYEFIDNSDDNELVAKASTFLCELEDVEDK